MLVGEPKKPYRNIALQDTQLFSQNVFSSKRRILRKMICAFCGKYGASGKKTAFCTVFCAKRQVLQKTRHFSKNTAQNILFLLETPYFAQNDFHILRKMRRFEPKNGVSYRTLHKIPSFAGNPAIFEICGTKHRFLPKATYFAQHDEIILRKIRLFYTVVYAKC